MKINNSQKMKHSVNTQSVLEFVFLQCSGFLCVDSKKGQKRVSYIILSDFVQLFSSLPLWTRGAPPLAAVSPFGAAAARTMELTSEGARAHATVFFLIPLPSPLSLRGKGTRSFVGAKWRSGCPGGKYVRAELANTERLHGTVRA